MRPKDIKAFLFFLIFSIVLWQFGETIKAICLKSGSDILNNVIFSISYSQNTGGAWNILQNQVNFLIFFSLIVLFIIAVYIYRKISFKNKITLLSLSILSGGILGNLAERINLGYVIDYIKLNFIDFPIFNIFDTMICTGVILYCLKEFFNEIKNVRKRNKN